MSEVIAEAAIVVSIVRLGNGELVYESVWHNTGILSEVFILKIEAILNKFKRDYQSEFEGGFAEFKS